MKFAALRITCATLLLLLALGASLGLVAFAQPEAGPAPPATTEAAAANSAASEEAVTEAPQALWLQMLLQAPPEAGTVTLRDGAGLAIATLTPDQEGLALSPLLAPGEYTAETALGTARFRLEDNAALTVLAGCAWSDGEILHLTAEHTGSVHITRAPAEGTAPKWLDYVLFGKADSRRQILRPEAAGSLTCVFSGLPEGMYALTENGVLVATVAVSAGTTSYISLP